MPIKRTERANCATAMLIVLAYGCASRWAFGALCALNRQFGTVAVDLPKTKLHVTKLTRLLETKLLNTKREVKKPFWEAFGLLQERLFKKINNEINWLAYFPSVKLNRSLSAATP